MMCNAKTYGFPQQNYTQTLHVTPLTPQTTPGLIGSPMAVPLNGIDSHRFSSPRSLRTLAPRGGDAVPPPAAAAGAAVRLRQVPPQRGGAAATSADDREVDLAPRRARRGREVVLSSRKAREGG